MVLIFYFDEEYDAVGPQAIELQNVIEAEIKRHFGSMKGITELTAGFSSDVGPFVEVDILNENFVIDLENAKKKMYKEHRGFMEDFVSDVQENCSYGGIQVTAEGR